ncbi:hypothetical protein V6N13_101458 [Hibiscus sabdariffa]
MYYSNSGYYVPYPTVKQPIGNMSQIATPLAVNPLPFLNGLSAYQASYTEIIKKAEELLKPQHSQEIKDFYNPGPQLRATNEEEKHLQDHIDKCYNIPVYYYIQVGLHLKAKAQEILSDQSYKYWTDGKRIFVNRWCNRSDEAAKQLLKRIADMNLKDYPYEILEGINATWDHWNSPESPASNSSMNLDETEEVNLANAQES